MWYTHTHTHTHRDMHACVYVCMNKNLNPFSYRNSSTRNQILHSVERERERERVRDEPSLFSVFFLDLAFVCRERERERERERCKRGLSLS